MFTKVKITVIKKNEFFFAHMLKFCKDISKWRAECYQQQEPLILVMIRIEKRNWNNYCNK